MKKILLIITFFSIVSYAEHYSIDKMTKLIDKKIQKIEVLQEEINLLIAQKEEKIICATIKSLREDISRFREEVENIKNLTKKERIKSKLKTHIDILNEEKSKLKNNQCIKVER